MTASRFSLLAALLAAFALAVSGCDLLDIDEDEAGDMESETDGEAEEPEEAQVLDGIPEIVAEVEPSVVTILREGGIGSGVIMDDGFVVTNAHVVGDLREVEVQLATGRRLEAEVTATDPQTDLAVLDTGEDALPAAAFADRLPQVGELAVAMGSPLGLENTVTSGIISGLNRAVPAGPATPQALVDLIQTDAPIAPGNSGGALVDATGEVVGINVAYASPGQTGATAIGFAIPSSTVTSVVEQLIETGEVEHAFLGIQPGPLTPQLIEQFDLSVQEGAAVLGVVDDSPAEDAGLEPGDVITEMDGEPLRTVPDLLGELRRREPGDSVDLTVQRGDEELDITVELGDLPESF